MQHRLLIVDDDLKKSKLLGATFNDLGMRLLYVRMFLNQSKF